MDVNVGVPQLRHEARSLQLKHNINMAVLDYRIIEYFLRLLNPTSAA
jgi:hypothetical protein